MRQSNLNVCPIFSDFRLVLLFLLLSLLSRAGQAHAEGPLELADQLRVRDGLPALVLAHHLRLLVDLLRVTVPSVRSGGG